MSSADAQDFTAQRSRMVAEVEAMYAETQRETGLKAMSSAVRTAMGKVERHRLVPQEQLRADLLAPKPEHVVLEVGTGSGYQAAVLAEVVRQVYSIELIESLGRTAAERLAGMGYGNVEVRIGDGYAGWPEKAPFDGIVVTAAAPKIPPALVAQLKPGGRMVIPVGGDGFIQYLKLVTKRADGGYDEREVLPVRFVPLVPKSGG